MSRERELIKNTVILSLGTFLPQITALVTLPILTACLTKAEYGTYDLIYSISSLVIPLFTLKLEMAAFRYMIEFRGNKDAIRQIISTLVGVSIFSIFIAVLFINVIVGEIVISERIIISVYVAFRIILMFLQQIARGYSMNRKYSLSAAINSIIYMLVIIYSLKVNEWGIVGVLLSLSLGEIVSSMYLYKSLGISRVISFKYFSIRELNKMLKYSIPLIPNSISLWIMNFSDRLIVTAFLGIEYNAVYTVANKLPGLISVAQNIFNMAWQENASMYAGAGDADEYYSKMFDGFMNVLTSTMCCVVALAPVLFRILIRGEYTEAQSHMSILFYAMYFSSISAFFGGIYIACKQTKSVGRTTVFSAVINVIINIGLINMIGLLAASISTLVSYMVVAIYRMHNIKKYQEIRYNYKRFFVHIFIIGGMCFLYFVNTVCSNMVNLLLGIVVVLIINRKMIKKVINGLKKLRSS